MVVYCGWLVGGRCEPKFARVREEFERNFAERGEIGASVCVLVDRELVDDAALARMATTVAAGRDAMAFTNSRYTYGFVPSIDNRHEPSGLRDSMILSADAFGHPGLASEPDVVRLHHERHGPRHPAQPTRTESRRRRLHLPRLHLPRCRGLA
jgi:hypothetical protein